MISQDFIARVDAAVSQKEYQSCQRMLQQLSTNSYEEQEIKWLFLNISVYWNAIPSPKFHDMDGSQAKEYRKNGVLHFLIELVPKIQAPLFRVQVWDLIWQIDCNFNNAVKAFHGYKELLDNTNEQKDLMRILDRMIHIERLYNQEKWKEYITQRTVDIFSRCVSMDNYLPFNALEFLYQEKYLSLDMLLRITEEYLEWMRKNMQDLIQMYRYERYLELKEKMLAKLKKVRLDGKTLQDPDLIDIRVERIKRLIEMAREEKNIARKKQLYTEVKNLSLLLSDYMEKSNEPNALELAKLCNQAERERIMVQRDFVENMETFHFSIDTEQQKKELLEMVKDLSTQQTFLAFLQSIIFYSREQMYNWASEYMKNSIDGMSYRTVVDAEGRTIAVLPPFDADDPKSVNHYAVMEWKKYADLNMFLIGDTIFAHMIRTEEDKQEVRELLSDWTQYALFIPIDRKKAFEKGISAGLDLDYCSALSILVPQIENAFFVMAKNLGIKTYNLKNDGVEERLSLETVINSLKKYLSEDTCFVLDLLFISKTGYNIRNRLAHGMLSDEFFDSREAFTIWCLLIKLIFSFFGIPSVDDLKRKREKA